MIKKCAPWQGDLYDLPGSAVLADPVYTIGDQIAEVLKVHNKGMSKQAIKDRSIELMRMVGIPSPADRLRSFPHEFSGGMRQRIMIAMAIANDPRVLIADEPTTALDVTIQAQVLEVMQKAQEETGAATIMITHDLGVVAGMADDILVMYAGKPVEIAGEGLYKHPSTRIPSVCWVRSRGNGPFEGFLVPIEVPLEPD